MHTYKCTYTQPHKTQPNTQTHKLEMSMRNVKSNKRGRYSDKILLDMIKDYPGLSQYELAKKSSSSSGRVDGSVRRLLKQHHIFIRVLERNGRRVNLIYPSEERPSNLLEVPIDLLKVGNPLWDKDAFIYALDSSTIGVSGKEMQSWKKISCFQQMIPLKKEKGKVEICLPESFQRFYNMERKHRIVSLNGNNILITISGDIVEEKKYPS